MKRRKDENEEATKSGKRNVNGENGKMKNEDHVREGKKKKIEKSGGKIKIISWNVAGVRAWIKVNLIFYQNYQNRAKNHLYLMISIIFFQVKC